MNQLENELQYLVAVSVPGHVNALKGFLSRQPKEHLHVSISFIYKISPYFLKEKIA